MNGLVGRLEQLHALANDELSADADAATTEFTELIWDALPFLIAAARGLWRVQALPVLAHDEQEALAVLFNGGSPSGKERGE